MLPERLEYLNRVQAFINVLVESAKTNAITEQDFYLVLGAKVKSMNQERREKKSSSMQPERVKTKAI